MKIAIGADHGALLLKNELRDSLRQSGHEVTDFGTDSTESTDYPDYALPVAQSWPRLITSIESTPLFSSATSSAISPS